MTTDDNVRDTDTDPREIVFHGRFAELVAAASKADMEANAALALFASTFEKIDDLTYKFKDGAVEDWNGGCKAVARSLVENHPRRETGLGILHRAMRGDAAAGRIKLRDLARRARELETRLGEISDLLIRAGVEDGEV